MYQFSLRLFVCWYCSCSCWDIFVWFCCCCSLFWYIFDIVVDDVKRYISQQHSRSFCVCCLSWKIYLWQKAEQLGLCISLLFSPLFPDCRHCGDCGDCGDTGDTGDCGDCWDCWDCWDCRDCRYCRDCRDLLRLLRLYRLKIWKKYELITWLLYWQLESKRC